MAIEHLSDKELDDLEERGISSLSDDALDRLELDRGHGQVTNITEKNVSEGPTLKDRAMAGVQAASETADEINTQTTRFAERDLSEAGPLEGIGILANRGLAGFTSGTRALGKLADKGALNTAIDLAVPDSIAGAFMGATVKKAIESKESGVSGELKEQGELIGSQLPRTPMQSVFLGVTTPAADVKGAVEGSSKVLKGLVKEAALPKRTSMNALRSPAERFPESKLAKTLERFFRGTDGADRFNIANQAAVNKSKRVIQEEGIKEVENELGYLAEKQTEQTLKHEVKEAMSEQNTFLSSEKAKRKNVMSKLEDDLHPLRQKKTELADSAHKLAVEEQRALKVEKAQKAAIEADLAVDEALGLDDKAERGMQVSRDITGAIDKAKKKVNVFYDVGHSLAENVPVNPKDLDVALSAKLREAVSQITVLPEDKREVKLLTDLRSNLAKFTTPEDKAKAIGFMELFKDSKSKIVSDIAVEQANKNIATLSDLEKLYADLNDLARSRGDSSFAEARDEVLKIMRRIGESAGPEDDANIAIKMWDRAREARMHLDTLAQNKTVEKIAALTGKNADGDPAKIMSMVLGEKSEIPLVDFMRIAPENAKGVVRRESLRNGFEQVTKAPKGKAEETLNSFIKNIGERNFETLHNGMDSDSLRELAKAQDSLAEVERAAPEVKKQVDNTYRAMVDLIQKAKSEIKASKEASSANRQQTFDKLGKLQNLARKETIDTRQNTVDRIAKGIEEMDKALAIRAKSSQRVGEAGRIVVDTLRSDDKGGNTAFGAGLVGEGLGAMTGNQGIRNTSRLLLAYGIVSKSPRVLSNLYYSNKGRALMEAIASAPTTKEAAMGLIELAKITGPSLGKYGGMAAMNKDAIWNEPKEKPRGKSAGLPNGLPSDQRDPELESTDDETYQWPVR